MPGACMLHEGHQFMGQCPATWQCRDVWSAAGGSPSAPSRPRTQCKGGTVASDEVSSRSPFAEADRGVAEMAELEAAMDAEKRVLPIATVRRGGRQEAVRMGKQGRGCRGDSLRRRAPPGPLPLIHSCCTRWRVPCGGRRRRTPGCRITSPMARWTALGPACPSCWSCWIRLIRSRPAGLSSRSNPRWGHCGSCHNLHVLSVCPGVRLGSTTSCAVSLVLACTGLAGCMVAGPLGPPPGAPFRSHSLHPADLEGVGASPTRPSCTGQGIDMHQGPAAAAGEERHPDGGGQEHERQRPKLLWEFSLAHKWPHGFFRRQPWDDGAGGPQRGGHVRGSGGGPHGPRRDERRSALLRP